MELALGGEVRRTAHQMVRDTLRRAILDGSLPPGTRLVQADIAAQLAVSTTPVREALRDLATEGLIHVDAHRGATVHQMSVGELREIYDMRRLLEPEAVRRAAGNLSDEQLAELEGLHGRMVAESDPVRWVELNRTFHRTMVGAAGSRRLVQALHRLEDAALMYVGVAIRTGDDQLEWANDQHQALLAAVRDGDGDAAAEIVREHMSGTLEIVEHGGDAAERTD